MEVELFDVWGINFMGPSPPSCGHAYIILSIDDVSKWIGVIATQTNGAKEVLKFLYKHIFIHFGTPRVIEVLTFITNYLITFFLSMV